MILHALHGWLAARGVVKPAVLRARLEPTLALATLAMGATSAILRVAGGRVLYRLDDHDPLARLQLEGRRRVIGDARAADEPRHPGGIGFLAGMPVAGGEWIVFGARPHDDEAALTTQLETVTELLSSQLLLGMQHLLMEDAGAALDSLVDAATELIGVLDERGHVVYANQALLAALGTTRQAALHRPVLELIASRSHAELRDAFARVPHGRIPTLGLALQTRDGGMDIEGNAVAFVVGDRRLTIGVFRDQTAGGVRVSVRDRGPGISPGDVPRLFERFTRIDGSSRTGLGLAISRALVELHEGTLGVETEVGTGSTFWFVLPTGTLRDVTPLLPVEARRHTVIVVAHSSHRALTTLLEQLGLHVVSARGADPREMASVVRPSLLVIDEAIDAVEAARIGASVAPTPTLWLGKHAIALDDARDPRPASITAAMLRAAVWPALRRAGPARVLIAESDPSIGELLALHLGSPLVLAHVGSGVALFDVAIVFEPDVIILEPDLPGGEEAVARLRACRLRAAGLLVHAARDVREGEREALQLGPTLYLTKSRVTLDQVVWSVYQLLARNGLGPDR
jgi:PAS domain S-box-containing protein